jgi:hypothetical protein
MAHSKLAELDSAIDEFALRIKPGSILSGQQYADESLKVLKAIRSTVGGLVRDFDELSEARHGN